MCSILLLEDHADTSRVLKRLLHHWGHEVATADRVTKALDLANGQTFDVILSDIALPDGDGCNFMREVRQGRCRRALALAVSAYTAPADRVRAKLAGFHGYFAKPIDLNRLRTLLASVIQSIRLAIAAGLPTLTNAGDLAPTNHVFAEARSYLGLA